MITKPHDVCRELGCSRKTQSGRPEKEREKRYCAYHSPENKALLAPGQKRWTEAAVARRKPGFVPKKIGRVETVPLICVFKEYEVTRDNRVVFQRGICGEKAPRRLSGDRTLPRYPNRFGEPLCEDHKHLGDDLRAFPDDPTYLGEAQTSAHPREEEEERAAHAAKLERLLKEAKKR